ncbi:hypothetical protein FBUS_09002 [Fasciolopsis buskii]|uniref:Osteopetrosis associated transmembrane protein n=1 Tax=Fasciolopsis buskii TaxID=27845 RepID=A0A8E0RWB7_9TREM|nr:hypothetical protein FBUS_09002 [Fasciolopsis buski]
MRWLFSVIVVIGYPTFHCAETSCSQYKNQFSALMGSTSKCFSSHLSPVSLCGWCPDQLANLHSFIADRTVVNPSGVPCVDLLLSDKSVVNLVSFVTDMWNRSFCSQCLIKPVQLTNIPWAYRKTRVDLPDSWDVIGSPSVSVSSQSSNDFFNLAAYNNITVQFFARLNETLDCLSSFLGNHSASILDVLSFPASEELSINHSACSDCSAVYSELLTYYKTNLLRLNIELGGGVHRAGLRFIENNRFAVCNDIQNALNRTQWAWSKLFNCHPVERNTLGAFMPLIICSISLLLFHVLSYSVCRRPTQMLIYRPKRVELKLRPNISASHMTTSTTLRDQLSTVPSYGSMGSSSIQNVSSNENPTQVRRLGRNKNESSRL